MRNWDAPPGRNEYFSLEALAQALGSVGMVRFLQQFDGNKGDYTQERDKLLNRITMDDILAQIQENRERKQSDA